MVEYSKDYYCNLKILEASLLVCRRKIVPSVLLTHARALSKAIVKYPLTRVGVNTVSLHSGVHGETIDNSVLGQLPKRIIIVFGNEPIGTDLVWPPVVLSLTTVLRTSGRASLTSRAQRALSANQGSRPKVTTCAANYGPSHVVFSLGGSEMFSPSCRLAEQPLLHLSIV